MSFRRSLTAFQSSRGERGASGIGSSPRLLSGSKPDPLGPRAVDVWAVAKQFPARWAIFMHEVYGGDVARIMLDFGVCERTARKWVRGEGGVNSRHSTVAQLEHPEAYAQLVLREVA